MYRSLLVFTILCTFQLLNAQVSENITFEHTDKSVKAIFTKPAADGVYPVVIIGPGSGPNDVDGTIPLNNPNAECLFPEIPVDTLTPYKDLAEALVDGGYAVLRYEKIEYTHGADLGEITFEKIWMPLMSAVDYIKTRNDIKKDRIILLGHSESVYIIPFVAKQKENIHALVAIAGARQPLDSLLAYQLVNIARKCGGDTAVAKMQAEQIQHYFTLIRTNNYNEQTPPLFGVPPAEWFKYLKMVDGVAKNYNQVDAPVLFVALERDANVELKELKRFKADVNGAVFIQIADVTHYMNKYNEGGVAPEVSGLIIGWLDAINKTADNTIEVDDDPTVVVHIKKGKLRFKTKSKKINAIAVFNSNKQTVFTKVYNNGTRSEKINISGWNPGSYTVELVSGETILKKVLVIK